MGDSTNRVYAILMWDQGERIMGGGRSSIGASNLAQESAPLQYWAYERKFNFFKVDHWPEIKLLYHYKNHIIRGPPLFGKSHSQNFWLKIYWLTLLLRIVHMLLLWNLVGKWFWTERYESRIGSFFTFWKGSIGHLYLINFPMLQKLSRFFVHHNSSATTRILL